MAQVLETPTDEFGESEEQLYTSIPFLISAYLIEVVLQKEADPAAHDPTKAFRIRSFEPVADLVRPEVIFLSDIATSKAELTATPYPFIIS